MPKRSRILVKETAISVIEVDKVDFISLTDMSGGFKEGSGLIGKWITNKNTLEYIGVWEKINNPDFNYPEFGVIEKEAGVNRFIMSVGQWVSRTNAKGMIVKAGRYGGTYAHKDIAFHFAMWLSPEFQIYLVNEFQRLKSDENDRLKLNWDLNRTLSKLNYRIHTDAIKEKIIPDNLSNSQISFIYANEADVLNVALFGKTAKEWREENPEKVGNIRDFSTIEQLLVLANLESLNAEFIKMGLSQSERLIKLNQTAISQMKSLAFNSNIKKLKE